MTHRDRPRDLWVIINAPWRGPHLSTNEGLDHMAQPLVFIGSIDRIRTAGVVVGEH